MSRGRILLIEDDPRISSFIERGLKADGYLVETAHLGQEGLALARSEPYALVILDYVLPDIDGLQVCAGLREEGSGSLVLMLTARAGIQDKIAGLKSGADDYLTKPFDFDELLARIEALLRRQPRSDAAPQILTVGDLAIDLAAKQASLKGRALELTPKEYNLLAYLMAHADVVVSRSQLLSNVWGINFEPNTKVVEVYIQYLRRKLDQAGEPSLIRTVRGFGYTLRPQDQGLPDPAADDP